MENSSLSTDVWNDVTTSPSLQSGDLTNLVFKVLYSIIAIVGVLDNLFVLIVFILFIKITDKVFQNARISSTRACCPMLCNLVFVFMLWTNCCTVNTRFLVLLNYFSNRFSNIAAWWLNDNFYSLHLLVLNKSNGCQQRCCIVLSTGLGNKLDNQKWIKKT